MYVKFIYIVVDFKTFKIMLREKGANISCKVHIDTLTLCCRNQFLVKYVLEIWEKNINDVFLKKNYTSVDF